MTSLPSKNTIAMGLPRPQRAVAGLLHLSYAPLIAAGGLPTPPAAVWGHGRKADAEWELAT